MKGAVFIAGNTPSSKNGRRFVRGRSIGSPSTEKYYKESKQFWIDSKDEFVKQLKGKTAPYKICFLFVRGSKRRFDYLNPCQTAQDMMVKYEWLPDDNMEIMIPVFEPYQYDKENPGVYIKVL